MPNDPHLPLGVRLRAMPDAERERILLDVITECTAHVLGYPGTDDLDPDLTFPEAGVDSLTASRIRSRIAARIGVPVPRARFGVDTSFFEAARILSSLVEEAPSHQVPG
ncbi:acyl carrier protein [Streptomyces odontomachi]|uniref:acyl carrier protein n=1 Tax=Streptomyces odontomachi TaxID=2944940 RepID=UPI00210EA4C6|nr:acyl carrier protein [Streptomyces sp. ODS25]